MRPRQAPVRYAQVAALAAVVGVCGAGGVVAVARGSADATLGPGVVLGGSATTSFGAPNGSESVQLLSLPRVGEARLACRQMVGGGANQIAFLFRNTTSTSVWLMVPRPGIDAAQVGPGQTVSMHEGGVPGLVRLVAPDTVVTLMLVSRDAGKRCTGTAQAMLNSSSGRPANDPHNSNVSAGTGARGVVTPAIRSERVRVATVRNTTQILSLPRLGEIRLGCWATVSSSAHQPYTDIVFYVRNTQRSRLLIDSDSQSKLQLDVSPRAIAAVTGHSVIRGYKNGVFPALLRVTGAAGTATIVASGGMAGQGRCTAVAQAMLNPLGSRKTSRRGGTVLSGTVNAPFVGAGNDRFANAVRVLTLPGLGEVQLSCISAPPGPVWFPLIVFSLRNTQSHPISVISDTYAQMVTARPGAVVSLPAMTIRLVVGRAAVGPEIAQVWGGGRIATLTLTGNLTSNGAFVPNVYSATNGGTSAGTINGCIGLAQAVLNQ